MSRRWSQSVKLCGWRAGCAALVLALAGTVARGDVVAHWTFDDLDNGVYADSSGSNAYPATPKDAGSVTAEEGKFGKGIRFNGGTGAYLTIPPLKGIQNKSITVAVWVNYATAGPNFVLTDWETAAKAGFVFGIDSGSNANKSVGMSIVDLTSTERIGGSGGSANNRRSIVRQSITDKTVPLGEWHHMAWVWDHDSATVTTYLDGDSIGSLKHGTGTDKNPSRSIDIAVNEHPMRIGSRELGQGRPAKSPTFAGAMDELWVFDQALTAVAIRNLKDTNTIRGKTVIASTPAIPATPATPVGGGTPATPADTGTGTGSGATTPMVADGGGSSGDAPVRPRVIAKGSGQLSPGRVTGIVFGLVVVVGMACYLIWAVTERGKLRMAAGR